MQPWCDACSTTICSVSHRVSVFINAHIFAAYKQKKTRALTQDRLWTYHSLDKRRFVQRIQQEKWPDLHNSLGDSVTGLRALTTRKLSPSPATNHTSICASGIFLTSIIIQDARNRHINTKTHILSHQVPFGIQYHTMSGDFPYSRAPDKSPVLLGCNQVFAVLCTSPISFRHLNVELPSKVCF